MPDFHDGRVRRIADHAARIALGGIFLYASIDKIAHPQDFAQAIYNYQILPGAAVNPAALILPWLELLTGICLIGGFWLPGAVLLSTGLLTVFIGALAFNLMRGLDIHCGCFSTASDAGSVDVWTVARDLVFLAVSVYLTAAVLFKPPAANGANK